MFKSNMSGAVDSESYKFKTLYTKSYSPSCTPELRSTGPKEAASAYEVSEHHRVKEASRLFSQTPFSN